jgi:pimeloyl-ACP methyl ester carboxylesterase
VWRAASREAALEAAEAQLGVGGSRAGNTAALNLAPSDERLFADPRWQSCWSESIAQWFAQGTVGYADDRLADRDGWHTFDVRRIACPVVVLHGTSDTYVPVAHAPYTRSIVPGAKLELREGLGHFSILPAIVPVLGNVLAELSRAA